ncbi:MAG: carboxypeptidase regulatory-like domain-containing protein [Terracidiphilus sp.]|nr:carboxypeptidase regulatory-like domain-containing protein [Terracidiphilus sp.]
MNFLWNIPACDIRLWLRRNRLRTHTSRSAGLATFFLFLLFLPLHAQEYRGTITGHVQDPTGAAVPDASITAVGPQQTYSAKADAQGDYMIPFIQPGTYTVTAEAPGFKKAITTDVVVDIMGKLRVAFRLEVGAVSAEITVSANPVGIDIDDASGGMVLDPGKVQNLPLNGGQVYQLLTLVPGVKFTTTSFGPTGNTGTRGWDESNSFNINGQTGTYNQFFLNGAPISQQADTGAGTWNISPSIDAVQEFKVMTTIVDAQYGRIGGGGINTILKSGTNKYHGTLYEFWQNSSMEANVYQLNQVNSPRQFHNQHQFGGTAGGPFAKQAFFFFSYEGWREVLPGGIVTTVPRPDMFPDATSGNVNLTNYLAAVNKAGIYDPLTVKCTSPTSTSGCNTYARSAFANNTIPANRISPIGLKIMSLYPAPNRAGYTKNYVYSYNDPYSYNMPIGRVDYNLSERDRIYGILAWWSGQEMRNKNGIPGTGATLDNLYRSSLTQVVDLTHTFNEKKFADIRISFNRMYNVNKTGTVASVANPLSASDLGLNMPAVPTTNRNWAPAFSLGDSYPDLIGNTVSPVTYETYDFSPSMTQILHRHSLHYGFQFEAYHGANGGVGQPNGNFSFSTGFTQKNPLQSKSDGSVLANVLLGYPSGGSVEDTYAPYKSFESYGAYIQDDWRVRSNLTFNLGLRWDTQTSPHERHNRLLAGFCFTCVNPLTGRINYPAGNLLPNGVSMVNPILGGVQFASDGYSAYAQIYGPLEPKLGVSWGINKNMVIHGAWTYSSTLGYETGTATSFSATTSYISSPDNNIHPSSSFLNSSPFPNGIQLPTGTSLGLATLVGNTLTLDMRDRKIPLVQNWQVGLKMQLPFALVGELDYAGSSAQHLRTSKNYNGLTPAEYAQGNATPSYLDQQVNNPFYGVLPITSSLGANQTIAAKYLMVSYPQYYGSLSTATDSTGRTNYNALFARLEKRISGGGMLVKGASFLSSFTWSKTMTAYRRLNNGGAGLVDPNAFYEVDNNDRPWDFAFSGMYGLPVGKGGMVLAGARGLTGTVVNDWSVEWIFRNDGGLPVSYPNSSLFNCGNYSIRPQHRSWGSWLNNSQSSCFTTFPEYTAVTHGNNSIALRTPWAQQTSLGLKKKFVLTDRLSGQFKAEAFNLTNTPIFGAPSSSGPQTAPVRNTSVSDPNQPGAWSGYGTVGSTQQNFPRRLELSAKIFF